MRYIAGAFLLLGLAAYMHADAKRVENAPLAMVRAAQAAGICVGNRILYRDIELSCDSKPSYVDMRKLDMRADNRAGKLVQIAKKK